MNAAMAVVIFKSYEVRYNCSADMIMLGSDSSFHTLNNKQDCAYWLIKTAHEWHIKALRDPWKLFSSFTTQSEKTSKPSSSNVPWSERPCRSEASLWLLPLYDCLTFTTLKWQLTISWNGIQSLALPWCPGFHPKRKLCPVRCRSCPKVTDSLCGPAMPALHKCHSHHRPAVTSAVS